MKIDINRIPFEGLTLGEEVNPSTLDLDTEIVKFHEPIKIRAHVSKITNAVTVDMHLSGSMYLNCSRCLGEFKIGLEKNLKINYQADKIGPVIDTSTAFSVNGERSRTIDLDQDIKEEIILGYPIKPLCKPDCKGLCPNCGKNLNEGGCHCAITKKKAF